MNDRETVRFDNATVYNDLNLQLQYQRQRSIYRTALLKRDFLCKISKYSPKLRNLLFLSVKYLFLCCTSQEKVKMECCI